MKLTVMAGDDRFLTVDVESTEIVEGVKAIVEVETGIPVANQSLLFQGAVLADSTRLDSCGVSDSDMLVVIDQGPPPAAALTRRAPAAATGGPAHMQQNEDGSAVDPKSFREAVLANRDLYLRLTQVNPQLAAAIEENNIEEMQKGLRAQREQAREQERKTLEERELYSADPFDPVAQAKIEDRIRQENIDLNLEVALEHNPEQFVAVHMLYVDMEVNGHPIKAFVDSGAQQTIMSEPCAERCGLMRLLDKRFHGTAVGVGTSKIVGIIHAAPLKIGVNFYSCRISVLEALNTDFLFGLDMLRRHQCCIDLQANVLRVGGGEITAPFLQEKDCPKKDLELLKPDAPPAASSAAGPSSSAPSPMGSFPQKGPSDVPAPSAPAAAPSQPNAPPAAAPAGQGQVASMETKIARLVELGFPANQAREALLLTNGNEEQAAGILFGGF